MTPAFITALSAVASPPSRSGAARPGRSAAAAAPASRARTRSRAPPKRVRVSDLTRKYRAKAVNADEAQLIGSTAAAADSSPSADAATTAAAAAAVAAAAAAAAAAASRKTRDAGANLRLSRFPRSWTEAVSQACDSACAAAAAGFDRLRVDLRGAPPQHGDLLLEAAAELVARLTAYSAELTASKRHMFGPRGAVVLVESATDLAVIEPLLQNLSLPARAAVLGDEPATALAGQLVVVVAPDNRSGPPERIELVEQVHYSNWTRLNWVVLLNPDLISLSGVPGPDGEPRMPGFLSDYCASYFVDPAAFPSRFATGAVLRSFPRKWEMYLLKGRSERTGFRLVAEQQTRPTDERIQCEFSWRVEREMDAQADAVVKPKQLVG